jgi:hypothetical protein
LPSGGFIDGEIPDSGEIRMMNTEEGLFTKHIVTPAAPEPSAIILLGLGAGLAALTRPRRDRRKVTPRTLIGGDDTSIERKEWST